MAKSGRRWRLQDATREAHARTEQSVEDCGSFGSAPSYLSYLKATLRAREPIELALDAAGASRLFAIWQDRQICAALRHDIQDMAGEHLSLLTETITRPAIINDAYVLGALYVLEGSALGARTLILRAAKLEMQAEHGARHLAQQCSMPAAWRTFLLALEAPNFTDTQEQECVASAIATFARFEQSYHASAFSAS